MSLTSRRRGFTLVEMLVAIVLLAIVGGTLMRVISRQQRFYRGVSDVMDQRSQLRQALGVLARDLRQSSSVGGDILSLSDSAVEFNTLVATGIICAVGAGRTQIDLPPVSLANGQTLTNIASSPRDGDLLFAYNDSTDMGTALDRWQQDTVVSSTQTTATCVGAPYTDAVNDAGKPRWRIAVTGALSPNVALGNPVRVTRRMRYKLHQAQDGLWYLGWSDWNGSAWSALEPVSGPYRPYSTNAGAPSGLTFRYYDSTGVEITSNARRLDVARIDAVVRARTRSATRVNGLQAGGGQYADSLAAKLALRNRS